jgi:glutamate formiminotransferase
VVERVRALAAARGARPVAGEIVGLVPEGSLDGLADDLPLAAFDPAKQVIERRVRP